MKLPRNSPFAVFAGIGFEIVGLILGAVWLGGYLDRKFGLQGIFTLILILLAATGWMLHVFFLLRRLNQNSSDQK
ncbi:MAG: AtpZ/AtpI family protein [Bdellovibrionales bacterium]